MPTETATTNQRLLEVVRTIKADAEADANKLERRPFDARNVAEVFGETLALVHGLAGALEVLLVEREGARK